MTSTDENTPRKSKSQTTPILHLQGLNSLPFNRRQVDRWNNEFVSAVEFQPVTMELFNRSPVIELGDADDSQSINRLRECFTHRQAQRQRYMETIYKTTKDLAHHLKERQCFTDLNYAQNRDVAREIEQLKLEYAELNNNVQMIAKENNALKTRLAYYGANDVIDRQRGEEVRKQARMKETVIGKQRFMLRQVEEILENSRPETGKVASLKKRFDEDVLKSKRNVRGPRALYDRAPSPCPSSGSSASNFTTLRDHRRSQSMPRKF